MGPKRMLTDAALVYCALIWGATFPLVKAALEAVDPVALVGYRFLLSAALLLPWVLRKKRPWILLREGMVLGTLLMLLYVFQTAGLRFTTASNSGFLTGLFVFFVPLFLFVFSLLRKGKADAAGWKAPSKAQWGAVLLAVAGLWVLTGGSVGFNKGDSLTLFAAMMYAAHLLACDRFVRRDADPVLLAFHQFWFCGSVCFALCWALGSSAAVKAPWAWGAILFLGIFPNLTAFFIQLVAQKTTPPVKVSLIFSLEPVFAALFAWTLGAEPFTAAKALGGALILSGTVLGELSRLAATRHDKEVLPA